MKRRGQKSAVAVFLTVLLLTLTACRHEHDFGQWELTQKATCTQNGWYTRSCKCGEEETLPAFAMGHTESLWIVDAEADCSRPGKRHVECAVCGETMQEEEIPVTGEHSYAETVIIAATCSQDGKKSVVCTVCGDGYTEVIPGGHHWVDAACDIPKTCSVCKLTEGEAPGHLPENSGTCGRCGITLTADFVREHGIGSLNWDGSLPLTTSGEKLIIGVYLEKGSRVINYDTNPLTLWLEEQTGVDIQFCGFAGALADVQTQIYLMISGGERLPDIMPGNLCRQDRCLDYVQAGNLVNLAACMVTDSYYLQQALELACREDPARYETVMNGILSCAADPKSGMICSTVNVVDGQGGLSFEPMWVVTRSCKNVRLAWRFLDYLNAPEAMLRQVWGVEGVDWAWVGAAEHPGGVPAEFILLTDGQRKDSRWFLESTYRDENNWRPRKAS